MNFVDIMYTLLDKLFSLTVTKIFKNEYSVIFRQ